RADAAASRYGGPKAACILQRSTRPFAPLCDRRRGQWRPSRASVAAEVLVDAPQHERLRLHQRLAKRLQLARLGLQLRCDLVLDRGADLEARHHYGSSVI